MILLVIDSTTVTFFSRKDELVLTGDNQDISVFVTVVCAVTRRTIANGETRGLVANQLEIRRKKQF